MSNNQLEKKLIVYSTMFAFVQRILDWVKSLFWKEEMELTLVGLQNSGKTTFVNLIASGQYSEDMIPTVGFNMRKITKGNVTIKIWDIGGQPRFRSMWERYCRGVNAIVFMVDSADHEKLEPSAQEFRNLLEKPQLQGIPVLVLGNKRDLPNALEVQDLIQRLGLSPIKDREICCYSISCKEKENIELDFMSNQNQNATKKSSSADDEQKKTEKSSSSKHLQDDQQQQKDKKLDLTSLEEDDEFEEFPVEEWTQDDLDDEDTRLWEEHWDDNVNEDDFFQQLKQELEKKGSTKPTTTATTAATTAK
ncbi:unnamed protein product [Didymodactylos carnosus]|uniref:26S proteasome complex subunit SEM1 n=1 Tax=Didymodactylos carnosus TaxID=1234261 RepID=A0A813YDE8_9BILA|nr:unnamed protein product [Didymodactylos carnosus]CAF0882633.1 unnamed protein product [Didymodactylos carnosus]CAF3636848.1 unnamed protein product [Didymodactylos carnosus]CAF3668530.1 unnamed protein product [Didymodactylos carnosus]